MPIDKERVQRILTTINNETEVPDIVDSLCPQGFEDLKGALESGLVTVTDGGDLAMKSTTTTQ